MMDELREQSIRRCDRKQGYRNPKLADQLAERATRKSGQLVVSYPCYECGLWHIGHAEVAQVLARMLPGPSNCEICGRPIHPNRVLKGNRKGARVTTCSKPCDLTLDARAFGHPSADDTT